MAKSTWTRRICNMGVRNFLAALSALLLLKIAIWGVNLFGAEATGYDPPYSMIPKLLLFVGSDVFGAALFAIAVTALCTPLLRIGLDRVSLAVSAVIQVIHAVFATLSFYSVVYMGGPLNKASFDLLFMGRENKEEAAIGELGQSLSDYVRLETVLFLLLVVAAALASLYWAPRLVQRMRDVWKKRLAVSAVIAAFFTVIVLPFLMSGEIGGIRIYTYGMEKSPVIELGWTYLRTFQQEWQIDTGLITDEFHYDFAGMQAKQEEIAPLAHATHRKTNLLIVAMESVGAPYLTGKETPMPFLRSLERRPGAFTFDNAYTTWSLTSKAFFSLFCSELPYPSYKAVSLVNAAIPCVTLSEVLSDRGYRTIFITGQNLGYDRQMRFYRHRKFDIIWDAQSMPDVDGAWTGSWGMDDRVVVEKVLSVAREKSDRPFFIFYGMSAGHHPFNCCREHEDNPIEDREKRYERALGFVDDRLADLVGGLEADGLLNDTLVVIFSDHGDIHGQRAGRNAWQPVVHVPLVLFGPQLGDSTSRTSMVTSLIDVSPTLLALLGMPISCTMKGRDLTTDKEHRMAFFGGRPPKWQLGVADENWKFIWEDKSVEMLFDISKDPGERTNLAESSPDRVAFYKNKVAQWSAFSTNLIENYAEILARSRCSRTDPMARSTTDEAGGSR